MRDIRVWSEEEKEQMLEHLKEAGEKALREDPLFNPNLRKSKKEKAEQKAKKFESYNWTTHKKKTEGLKSKILELKAKANPTEQEKLTLKRMQGLLAWHQWALARHDEGWSDKRIHEATLRMKSEREK